MTHTRMAFVACAGVLALAVLPPSARGLEPRLSQEPSIAEMAEQIFGEIPQEGQRSVILRDELNRRFLAFYIANYMGTPEMRAYMVPFLSAHESVEGLLAEAKTDEAFELLIGYMRLDLGAKYVSDVNLDGIRDEPVIVGTGTMRDRYHQDLFESPEAANTAYLEWLRRAVELVQS